MSQLYHFLLSNDTIKFPQSDKPLDVMVFFHGGGWQCGSGISAFYGPDHLMDHDIIYVGANFRLGNFVKISLLFRMFRIHNINNKLCHK